VKAWLRQQARRIDALTLRERAIMFVSLAVALVGAFDALLLSPGLAEHRALLQQMQAQAQELAALRARLAAAGDAGRAETPEGRLLAALAASERERAALQAEIDALLAAGDGSARLPALLERLLRRHEAVALVRLATTATPAPGAAGADAAAPPRRGVEVELRGPYLELSRFAAALDREVPGLLWADVHLDARHAPPLLSARLHLHGDAR
jgi:MSHA biogenesis protein MshJ